jgi:hypothetical protein
MSERSEPGHEDPPGAAEARREVVLRDQRDEDGTRYLGAYLDGPDLVISGQDLGQGVSRVFGEDLTEYEWTHTVRAEHVPRLVEALGAPPGTHVLDALEGFAGARAAEVEQRLAQVPKEFWSRVGD